MRALLALLLFLSLSVAWVFAQNTQDDNPILHEFVRIETSEQTLGRSLLPGEGSLPRGLVYNDEVVPQPSLAAETPENTVTPDEDTFIPDTSTQREGVLSYHEVFSPAITPFKRLRALNTVKPDDSLGISQDTLQPLPMLGNQVDPNRDRFYGALQLSLQANKPTAIPSVSPDARILSYQTSPSQTLSFSKDIAGNFYVTASKTSDLRLVFLTDAPKDYFDGPLPRNVSFQETPSYLVPKVSPALAARAEKVLQAANIDPRNRDVDVLLPKLVGYFRDFAPGNLPKRSDEDTYLALALSQRGVCRHRSYAFVLTAQSLGIAAQFTYNEAHAFVEVYIPKQGWRRIDLGGASAGMEVSGEQGKPRHMPTRPDPFPKGEEFEQTAPPPDARPSTSGHTDESSVATGNGTENGSGTGTPGEEPSEAPALPSPEKAYGTTPIVLSLRSASREALRGQALRIEGSAVTPEGPAGDVRIEILLSRPSEPLQALGSVTSAADGSFVSEVLVPTDLHPGTYQILLQTAGTEKYAPSRFPRD